jgi:hypothetical protein
MSQGFYDRLLHHTVTLSANQKYACSLRLPLYINTIGQMTPVENDW